MQLEIKYISLLSSRLRNFKRKKPTLWNFRCPICGDSEKDKKKARGNFYQIESKIMMHCYNCDINMTIPSFLKAIDVMMYDEFMRELMLEKNQFVCEEFTPGLKRPMYEKASPLDHLEKITSLPLDHHAFQYIKSRQIPEKFWDSIYYAEEFYKFVNKYVEKDKFSQKSLENFEHDRVVFPLIDKSGRLHGLQGRSFKADDPTKYISIVTDDSIPKLFGLDRVNFSKDIIVTEGPIDSLFFSNALSSCGGNITTSLKGFDKDKFIIVYDNETRKPETIKKMKQAIDDGFRILIFPENIKEKDVNNMILAGELTLETLDKLVKKCCYSGMTAKMKLTKWSKL